MPVVGTEAPIQHIMPGAWEHLFRRRCDMVQLRPRSLDALSVRPSNARLNSHAVKALTVKSVTFAMTLWNSTANTDPRRQLQTRRHILHSLLEFDAILAPYVVGNEDLAPRRFSSTDSGQQDVVHIAVPTIN